jgi:hypothetical protein
MIIFLLAEFFKQLPVAAGLYLQGFKTILISEVVEYNRWEL